MSMIITTECFDCRNCYDTENKNKIYCSLKQKEYYIGQRIPCEYKVKKTDNKTEDKNEEDS